VLAFTHTVGEFGVVLMIGGNIPGVTRYALISIYDQVQDFAYTQANHTALLLLEPLLSGALDHLRAPRRAGADLSSGRDVQHRLGELSLRVSCALSAPWTVLFECRSGAGKNFPAARD